jgi:predicted HTH domain antitoxin
MKRLKNKERRLKMSKQVVLDFPAELPEKSLKDKETLKKGKEAIVLELLRKGEISQGKAAELLGISRHDLLDLMAKHDIPMADFSPDELQRQREEA